MAAFLNLFTVATEFLLLFIFLPGSGYATTNEPTLLDVSSSELASRIWNSSEKSPLCVLYSGSVIGADLSKLEKSFYKLFRDLPDTSPFREWTFGYINTTNQTLPPSLHPVSLPSLQCHIGMSSPVEYSPQGTHSPSVKSIRRWMKKIVSYEFSERIPPVDFEQLDMVVSSQDGITVVGVPGYLYHQTLEFTLREVARQWDPSVTIFMVLPSTDNERNITKTFGLEDYPSVLLFDLEVWLESKRPVAVLQGPLSTGATQINLQLTINHLHAEVLNKVNFQEEVMDTASPLDPIAVTFYSPRNTGTLDYLYMLNRTINKFAAIDANFRFGLVDLVNASQVIHRYVDASFVTAIPFTVVFWQENEPQGPKFILKQQLFPKEMPIAQDLYDFLRDNDIPLSTNQERGEPWTDKKDVCEPRPVEALCSPDDNTTVALWDEPHSKLVVHGTEPAAPTGKTKTRLRIRKTARAHNIPYVTDRTWEALIEHSVAPPQGAYSTKATSQPSQAFSVALVVFIKERCGYCDKVIPTLEEIAQSVSYVGASLYLMNCSANPVNCKKQGITGYPTLTAFRSLSWSAAERCFPSGHRSRYIRVDYHGAVMTNLVLEWLSDINHPAVNKTFMNEEVPSDVGADDVRLVATLYTRALARRYLPSFLYNRWYPYDCYNLLCELLYGAVPCYAVYTRDVVDYLSKTKTDEKELVVSKLVMQRVDGVQAKLFELGYSLELTLNDSSDTRLHQFHHPHRYNISRGFKCEDDHATCNDVILQFVMDHKRLPVSHITTAAFHAKTSGQIGHSDHIFTHDLPVMLVLAHASNITRDSTFFKEVTQAAYVMYRDMVFVTLNTDEFSYWASNFVPKGYHAKHAFADTSTAPPLYHYPRLCIVRWDDHQKAAFYPPVEDLERLHSKVQTRLDSINSQQIIQFAQRYLTDPKEMLVRTEMF